MTNPCRILASAAVVADGITTDYLVTGTGRALLLLTASVPREDAILALARNFRVIAAMVPGDLVDASALRPGDLPARLDPEGSFARWLDGFLEGLGLEEVRIVADAHLGARVAACASQLQERVCGCLVHDLSGSLDLNGLQASLGG